MNIPVSVSLQSGQEETNVLLDWLLHFTRNLIIVKPANAPQSGFELDNSSISCLRQSSQSKGFRAPERRFPFFRNFGFLRREYSQWRNIIHRGLILLLHLSVILFYVTMQKEPYIIFQGRYGNTGKAVCGKRIFQR